MARPRFLRALRRGAGANPVANRLRAHEQRLNRQADRLDRMARRLDRQYDRLDNQARRIDQYSDRVQTWTPFIANLRVESGAISTQLAALETRVARLEAAPVDPGTENERAEARSIVEAARAEHAQVRARLTLIAAYEERLRRLEVAMREVVRVGGIVPEPMPWQLPVEPVDSPAAPETAALQPVRRLA
jgi:chromosome segregation ATPase